MSGNESLLRILNFCCSIQIQAKCGTWGQNLLRQINKPVLTVASSGAPLLQAEARGAQGEPGAPCEVTLK